MRASKSGALRGTLQSTPPRGGRPCIQVHPGDFQTFNPRPRAGGRPPEQMDLILPMALQSTPPRGGRLLKRTGKARPSSFNPRPRAGGDRIAGNYGYVFSVPSIHAPARGATAQRCPQVRHRCTFNPRPRAGGDAPCHSASRQGRPFNPRPRAGGDTTNQQKMAVRYPSIHAPARGATGTPESDAKIFHPSIHAPARGATRLTMRSPWGAALQSTPPRGGRLWGRVCPAVTRFASLVSRIATIPKNNSGPDPNQRCLDKQYKYVTKSSISRQNTVRSWSSQTNTGGAPTLFSAPAHRAAAGPLFSSGQGLPRALPGQLLHKISGPCGS